MLDLFSIKTNKFKKEEKPTNVRTEIAKEIIDIFTEPCLNKKLSFEFKVDELVPDILILDSQRIKQIIINLI